MGNSTSDSRPAFFLGPAAFISLSEEIGTGWPLWVKLSLPVLVTVLVAMNYLFAFIHRAWRHADLEARFNELARGILAHAEEPGEATLREWEGRRLVIGMD